jgi:putative nucleotidyltransferase with HDIG domain
MPEVDAANVMLLNPISLMLEFADSQGFTRKTIEELTLRPGEGTAGRAIMERIQIHISDPSQDMDKAHRKIFLEENFKSYHVQPLISKGRILGVLETYHRESPYAGNDWHEFLVAVADQAAIAIDNAQLLENLRRANDSLRLSYDATIEGWSNALDLRDKETEGHTQRVTTLTVDLARSMGISETNITHVRRGALLHDIGKMGVSDQILLKPGKLTDEEWEIMRQHPVHAYNLLSRIDFLRPALDIPRYHHERWDGAGYPDGLKGEQIPLTARIFAIVDVWDALTSDRPYRKAWSRKKALNYIIGQSGKYFDPKVVEKFIQLIQKAE